MSLISKASRPAVGVRGSFLLVAAAAAIVGILSIAASPVSAFASARPVSDRNAVPACGSYTVQSGDTLGGIAARYGQNWSSLAQMNGISDPNLIFPGQQIQFCGRAASVTTTTISYTASSASSTSTGVDYSGEFCQSPIFATGPISQWTVPPGCYAGIYRPNPANYVARSDFGQCAWWPQVLHPNNPSILYSGARQSQPIAGSVAVFAPGNQGASAGGHYAQVVAVLGNGWVLVSEMNFYWRGGGFGLVDYRYVHVEPGVSFIWN